MSDRVYVPVAGLPSPADLPDTGAITPAVPDPAVAPEEVPNTLLASAARLTAESLNRKGGSGGKRTSGDSWQEDAWEMYDLVGEMRFLVNVLASQGAKARFYVGKISDDPTAPPEPSEDETLKAALEAIGDGPSGLTQIIKRLFINLQVPGDGWLVGIPEGLLPENRETAAPEPGQEEGEPLPVSVEQVNLDDLEWRMLSVTEVKIDGDDVILSLGGDKEDEVKTTADQVYMIRVWSPHPRKHWEADSPTRSALPILRELVGLTMHISAQIDSRLAGAGVLLAPASATRAAKIAMGLDPDGPDDPFTDALIEAMITPISDRSNASAYVPLIWTVPDESEPHFRFMDFSKGLDAQAKDMRDESIRRYSLSADAPPELLLGVGGMNHWGAWLVQEDVVRAHLEPPLALVADAFTTQYLRPVMRELGTYTDEQIENTLVWYDVEHLIVRVSKGDDAKQAFADGIISAETYRAALGFNEDDAPTADSTDPAVTTVLQMVAKAPSLAAAPGLVELVRQVKAIMSGDLSEPTPPPGEESGTPAPESPAEGTPPPPEASSAPALRVRSVQRHRDRELVSAP